MAETGQERLDFTIYLEGQDVRRGNVLARAFLTKAQAILLVLAKMERAFIQSSVRQTDFEIVGADKRNPTTITLHPTPRTRGYNPAPALRWGLAQMATIGRGEEPDSRVKGEIAGDLAKLAFRQFEDSYAAFWINGQSEAVRFDDSFFSKATAFSKTTEAESDSPAWHTGVALGSVVGKLNAVDDVYEDREFVIVPPSGAAVIPCRFPLSMREEMHLYLFKLVRVEGLLHYVDSSPFPYRVDTSEDGISLYPKDTRKSLSQLRGIFSGIDRPERDWAPLLDG